MADSIYLRMWRIFDKLFFYFVRALEDYSLVVFYPVGFLQTQRTEIAVTQRGCMQRIRGSSVDCGSSVTERPLGYPSCPVNTRF